MKRALILIPAVGSFVLLTAVFAQAKSTLKSKSNGKISLDGVQDKIKQYAEDWGVDPALVKAIAFVESSFNPYNVNPSDPSWGLMQITPPLAYDYGLITSYENLSYYESQKVMDIDNNLNVACWFLNKLSKYSFDQQVQSYNVGEWGYKIGVRNFAYLEKVRKYYNEYSRV